MAALVVQRMSRLQCSQAFRRSSHAREAFSMKTYRMMTSFAGWREFQANDATEAMRVFRNTFPDSASRIPVSYLSVKTEEGQWVLARDIAVELGGYSGPQEASWQAIGELIDAIERIECRYRDADRNTVPEELLSSLRSALDVIRGSVSAEQFDARTTLAAITAGTLQGELLRIYMEGLVREPRAGSGP